jgi:type IV pilus assembly protein PilV
MKNKTKTIRRSKLRSRSIHNTGKQSGVSLMEVLAALFVMTTGLMGLLSLQSEAMRQNKNAYFRSQATLYASNIVETIRANDIKDKDDSDLKTISSKMADLMPGGTTDISFDSNKVTIVLGWKEDRSANSPLTSMTYVAKIEDV